jgi:UDP-N-acetyl-D-mannosaminuronate dehydrogenase
MKKVAIIGHGYVGLTISAFAAKSYQVIGFDNSLKVVSQLNQGISHIEGVKSEDLKASIAAGKYLAIASALYGDDKLAQTNATFRLGEFKVNIIILVITISFLLLLLLSLFSLSSFYY